MKLLQQTGYYFLGFSILILLIGGVSMFFGLRYMLDRELDENLLHTRETLKRELSKYDSLPTSLKIMDEIIDLQAVDVSTQYEILKDTLREIREPDGEIELEPFRQYIYTEEIKGKNYRIALNHSKFENEDLLLAIFGLITGFLVFFLLAINLFNRYISQQQWKPFYHTINQIDNFSVSDPRPITTLPTKIDEFKRLESAVQEMTDKLYRDYRSLKQFAENASHEIQTPLAIIQAQIELLVQQEGLEENALQHIQQIQQAAHKLSKLSQALLLLTRIENRQFAQHEKIALDQIIQRKLSALEPLLLSKQLKVNIHLSSVAIEANPDLVDILISNLLSNAIKHNLRNGSITITLDSHQFIIRNNGSVPTKDVDQLFERFTKADDASKSVGLGLAIVKEICLVYHWGLQYDYADGWHEVRVGFL